MLRQKLGVRRRRQIPIGYRLLTGDDPLAPRNVAGTCRRDPAAHSAARRRLLPSSRTPSPWPDGVRVTAGISTSGYGKHCDSRLCQRRRVILRPRLPRRSSTNRRCCVKTLVAPAGLREDDLLPSNGSIPKAVGARFTARRSSTDVAALALGLARVSPSLVPTATSGCASIFARFPARPRRSTSLRKSVRGPRGLAERRLARHRRLSRRSSEPRTPNISSRAWLRQSRSSSCHRLPPASVVDQRPPNPLRRAARAEPDDAGHGLRMKRRKSCRPQSPSPRPVAVANGWPAVSDWQASRPSNSRTRSIFPDSLYRFFAEEVLSPLDDEAKAGLATLVVAPDSDRELRDATTR